MNQIGIFKRRIAKGASCQRRKHDVALGKIAAGENAEFKKANPEERSGKKAKVEGGPRKPAAVEMVTRKIHAVETEPRGVQVFHRPPCANNGTNPISFSSRVGRVHGAESRSGQYGLITAGFRAEGERVHAGMIIFLRRFRKAENRLRRVRKERYSTFMCWYCGNAIEAPEPIGRSNRCADCGKDLRACKNCRFFRPGARGDCAETIDAAVADKERANFCDWFSLDPRFRIASEGDQQTINRSNAARSSFDALFGG